MDFMKIGGVRRFFSLKFKKGLSPVIASVLLIALVVVLAGIVFMWARGFISERIEKQGQPVDAICEQVNFEISLEKGAGGTASIDIVNRGNIAIYGFEIREVKEGETKATEFPFSVGAGETLPGEQISYDITSEEIIFFPKVLGTVKGKRINRPFTCLDYGKSEKL